MGDQQDGGSAGAMLPRQRFEEVEAVSRVQTRRRLVEQPDPAPPARALAQGTPGGARHPRAPPRRARRDPPRRRRASLRARSATVERESPPRSRVPTAPGPAGRGRACGSGRRDRRSAERTRCAARFRVAAARRASSPSRSTSPPPIGTTSGDHLQERRLSGSVLPEHRDDLAGGHRRIEAAQDRRAAVAGDEARGLEPVRARRPRSRRPQEQPREQRRAQRRRHRADRKLGRSDRGARDARRRRRASVAPTRNEAGRSVRWSLPNDRAHGVRNEEPDEADHAREGDRARRSGGTRRERRRAWSVRCRRRAPRRSPRPR